MRVRRLISVLSVCLAASVPIADAQPKAAPKKGPTAPAKTAPAKDAGKAPAPAPTPAPGPGAAKGPGGEEVQMTEDAPPKDLEGKDENPDAPRIIGEPPPVVATKTAAPKRTGYPIEEAMRPLTLPRNMYEVSLGPHAQLSPYRGADALRARYGITDKIQLGLAYVLAGIFDDPASTSTDKIGIHASKAVGIDLTVQLKDWVAVRLGVPVYIDPLAVSLSIGAPMKWQFADGKFALGVLDDVLSIKLYRFAPSFYQEFDNALAAQGTGAMGNNTIQSRGELRFSGYGVMQYQPRLAFIGRASVVIEDFSTTKSDGSGGVRSLLRAGLQYTVRKYLDLGFSLGFDDLAHGGTFGPAGLLAFRI